MSKARWLGSISFLLLSLFFGYWALGWIFGSGFSDFDLLFLIGFFINFLMAFGIHRLNRFFYVIGEISVIFNGISYALWALVLFVGMGLGIAAASTPLPWYSYLVLVVVFIVPFLIYVTASISFFVAFIQRKANSVVQNL